MVESVDGQEKPAVKKDDKKDDDTDKASADTVKQPPTRPKGPIASAPQPHTGHTMDSKAMESLGPLTNPLKGGLGEDMWSGSARSVVQEYLPKLPVGNTLRAVQLLSRRILLSNGDVGMLKNDASTESGQDIFTLRLEKLLEMGAYSDAVDLYTLIEGEPSHDRLARAGIMALLYDGYPAQACLEVRAAHKDKAETPDSDSFWSQMEAVCLYIQAESVRKLKDPSLVIASPVTGVPGSKVSDHAGQPCRLPP